jgi:hypothetical protein
MMKKLSMLGTIGGAALLIAAPFSLQWSQKNVLLSLDSAEAQTSPFVGVSRRVHRRAYPRAVYGTPVARVAGTGYLPPYISPPAYTSYYLPPYSYVSSYGYAVPLSYSYAAPYGFGYSPYFGYSQSLRY